MSIKEILRRSDFFGYQVGLTYKGKLKFRTVLGGIMCIFVIVFIAGAAMEELVQVLGD